MHRRLATLSLTTTLALATSIPLAHGQSLGEAAARERAKREAQAKGVPPETKAPERGVPGRVGIRSKDAAWAEHGAHPTHPGALLTAVYSGGPASQGGLEVGDIVTAVDGHEVKTDPAFLSRLSGREVGTLVRLRVLRNGATLERTVRVGDPRSFLPPSCEAGDLAACADWARSLSVDRLFAPNDPVKARELGQRACDGGRGDGCLAAAYAGGDEGPITESMKELLQKGCRLADATSCAHLALAYEERNDPAHEAESLQKACDLGLPNSCFNLGVAYEDGTGVPADFSRALTLHKLACDADELPACVNLALLYVKGNGTPPDPAKGLAILARACEQGLPRACTVAAWEQLKVAAVRPGPSSAGEQLEASCIAGDRPGCYRFGVALDAGEGGLARDSARAYGIFDRLCMGEYGIACFQQGMMLEIGRAPVTKDLNHAITLYDQGCRLGESNSCWAEGVMFATGKGVAVDKPRARKLLKIACDQQHEEACAWVKRLDKEP